MMIIARTPNQIGAVVRRERTKRNWTQGRLATEAGVRQETVSSVETGERPAKFDTVLRLLEVLDLELRVAARDDSDTEDFS